MELTEQELKDEEWREIEEFKGRGYEVSNLGRVRSWRRRNSCKLPAEKPTILTGWISKNSGYRNILFKIDGIAHSRHLSNVIAVTFIGPRPEGFQVAHEDGNRLNNRADNLKYKTPKDNSYDKVRHGTHLEGEKIVWHKLTKENVTEIYITTEPSYILAKKFNVSQAIIRQIRQDKKWKSVTKNLIKANYIICKNQFYGK